MKFIITSLLACFVWMFSIVAFPLVILIGGYPTSYRLIRDKIYGPSGDGEEEQSQTIDVDVVQGDITEYIKSGEYNVVAHGCNCFHTMGAGVAKVLDKYTNGELLDADKSQSEYGDINKLGSYSSVALDNVLYVNLYTQHGTGSDGVYVHWDSVRSGIASIVNSLDFVNSIAEVRGDDTTSYNILIPVIGCGRAGGELEYFASILNDDIPFKESIKITVVSYDERDVHNLKALLNEG